MLMSRSARLLRQLLAFCDENKLPRPSVVQNECHPLLIAEEVRWVKQQK